MPAQHFSLCMKQAVSNSHFGKRVERNRNSSRQSNKSVEMNERKKNGNKTEIIYCRRFDDYKFKENQPKKEDINFI